MRKSIVLCVMVFSMVVGPLTFGLARSFHYHLYRHAHHAHYLHHTAQRVEIIRHVSPSLACLTSLIYHEARGEKTPNKIAVARVALSRTDAPGFRPTVCGVIAQVDYRRHQHRRLLQFPWFFNHKQRQIHDMQAYHVSMIAAIKAIALHRRYGPTKTLYFNDNPRAFSRAKYKLDAHRGGLWFFSPRHPLHHG